MVFVPLEIFMGVGTGLRAEAPDSVPLSFSVWIGHCNQGLRPDFRVLRVGMTGASRSTRFVQCEGMGFGVSCPIAR